MFKKLFVFLFLLLSLLYVVNASHFRFGHISWQPVGAYNTIKFSSNYAFRTSFYGTSFANSIQIGSTVQVGSMTYGTGQGSVNVVLTVNSFNKADDWFTGDFSVTKNYPAVTVPTEYLVIFTSCCRIGSLKNNANGNWNITTKVRLTPGVALDQLNQSPVSGMVPIYNVINKRINKFNVVANDPNGDPNKLLSFSTKTLYSMTQPSGLSILTNGTATFTPTQTGLYSTQIVITDPQDSNVWVVVDFLLNSEDKTGFCHSTCSKPGTSCKYNSDCTGCTGTDGEGNVCTSNPPHFDYLPDGPTPNDGDTVFIEIGKTGSFSLQCTSPDTGKTTYIQTANLPSGIKAISNVQNQKTSLLSWTWTPSVSNAGSYVVSAYCTDNLGVSSTVTSFTISVQKPICGNGTQISNNKCSCTDGWDPNTNCFQCDKDHYGPYCQPNLPCENGASNGGSDGDGTCSCFYGWKGADCSISTQDYCSPTKPNSVTSYSNSDPSFINPTFSQIYINTDPSVAAVDLNLRFSAPQELENLNILVVMDAQPATEAVWNSVSTFMGTFVSKVGTLCEKTDFGLGFFSDATSGGYSFTQSRVIGDNIDVLKTLKYDALSTSSTKNSLAALTAASVYPVGWGKGTANVIILLTDNDYTATSAQVTALKNNLIGQSILPIVIGLNADIPNWISFMSTQGFGYAIKASAATSSSDWSNKAYTGLTTVLSSAVAKIADSADIDTFVVTPLTGPVATKIGTNAATDVAIPIKLKYPSKTVSTLYPEAVVSVVGFGSTRVVINYNHPPTASPLYITAKQNTDYTFTFPGSDMDGNKLDVYITSLPSSSVGTIKLNNVAVTANTKYDATSKFTFSPSNNYYTPTGGAAATFAFKINDGCLEASSTASITVQHVNQAPTCKDQTVNGVYTSAGSAASFVITGDDIDKSFGDTLSAIFVDISPLSGKGTVRLSSTAVTAGSLYSLASVSSSTTSYTQTFTFTQTTNPATDSTASIYYKIRDNGNLESPQCKLTFNLIHANVAPTVSAVTPIVTNQNNDTSVTITATDSDSESVKFTITTLSPASGGYFYLCSDSSKTAVTASYSTSLISLVASKASYSDICFHAPLVDTSATYLEFTATDIEGLTSGKFRVNINVVGARKNDPPTALPITIEQVPEDGISKVFKLDGTDPDELDQGKLTAIIVNPPKNGKLVVSTTSTTAAGTSSSAPYSLYYKPNSLFFGTDSFDYAVQDTLGARSTVVTATVEVYHVNHNPALSISPFSFTSQSTPVKLVLNPTDVDIPKTDDILTCFITTLPTKAQMFDVNNKAVELNKVIDGNSYYIKELRSGDKYGYTGYTDKFGAKCQDDKGGVSTEAFGQITFTYINTPPKANDTKVNVFQNEQNHAFEFIGSDLETPNGLKVIVNTLPTKGTLKKDGVAIDLSKNNIFNLNDLTYTPNKDVSDWDMPGNRGPSDQSTFSISDGSANSDNAVVYYYIEPRNPPTYNGLNTLYTKENEDLRFTIDGTVGGGGSNIYLQLTSIISNGTLYDAACNGVEGCTVKSPSKTSTVYEDTYKNSYDFIFRPFIYENGDNYATIQFKLYDRFGSDDSAYVYSGVYTIVINVIPVNQLPVVHLISYSTSDGKNVLFEDTDGNTVNMNVNTSVIIKYDGSDIDNAKSELVSFIPTLPTRGSLYNYDFTTQAQGAQITRNSPNVEISQDGYWYVKFVPLPGSAFDSYARIPFSLRDPLNGVSEPANVVINVANKNIPPVITTNETLLNGTSSSNTLMKIVGLSFDDPDSTNNNVSYSIAIVGENDDEPVSLDVATISFIQLSYCVFDEKVAYVNCTSSKNVLNSLVATTTITVAKDGKYRLKFVVDDLGYNSPKSIRAQNHLTATAYYDVTIKTPGSTTSKDNKTVLTAAIAASAGGAAIIAAAVWQLLRKTAPPTDAFFGDSPFSDGAVSSNPLYVQSANSAVNPLYNEPDDL